MGIKLNKFIQEIIEELLREEPELLVRRKLKYDEPSLHKNEDAPYGKPDPEKYFGEKNENLNEFDDEKYREENVDSECVEEDLIPRKKELTPYQKFFKKALEKYGVDSPDELTPKNKDKFFNYIDANWKSDEEEAGIEESSTSAGIAGYETPFAFSKPGTDPKKKRAVKAMNWPVVEASNISSWEKFLLTIDAVGENDIRKFLFDPLKEPYIDTPGDFHDQGKNKGTIVDYTKRNMGSNEYQRLYNFYKKYKTRCDAFVKKFGHLVNINESVDFKNPEMSPKKKIAYAVKGMREQLMQIENILDKSVNFKEETGLKTSDFYKRTHNHLKKIGEQVTRIMNKMQAIK